MPCWPAPSYEPRRVCGWRSPALDRLPKSPRERDAHRRAFAGIREIHDPAERERILTVRRNFQRHLIRGATDATGLRFDAGLALSTARCKISIGLLADSFRDGIERAVDDAFRRALLAALHDGVHQARHERALEFPILVNGPSGCLTSADIVSLNR